MNQGIYEDLITGVISKKLNELDRSDFSCKQRKHRFLIHSPISSETCYLLFSMRFAIKFISWR